MIPPSAESSLSSTKNALVAYLEHSDYEAQPVLFESYDVICETFVPIDTPRIIAVDGPTNAGKTSFAKTLFDFYAGHHVPVSYLPIDYFLTERGVRNGIFQAVNEGRLDIADYSFAAWDHVQYNAQLTTARRMLAGASEVQRLVIHDAYNRLTGRKNQPQSIPIYPGGVVVTEGVGLHAYHRELFDTTVRVDTQSDDQLLERVLYREAQKPPGTRLSDEYLRWRYMAVDYPHTAYLRQASAGSADILIDTTDFDNMVVYKKRLTSEGSV